MAAMVEESYTRFPTEAGRPRTRSGSGQVDLGPSPGLDRAVPCDEEQVAHGQTDADRRLERPALARTRLEHGTVPLGDYQTRTFIAGIRGKTTVAAALAPLASRGPGPVSCRR